MERPSDRIGTEVLFQNDRVRVWEMTLAPGESSTFHRHVNDYLVIYVAPTHLELRFEGQPPRRQSYDDGFVQYIVVGEGGGTAHQIENVDAKPHRQLIVELLGGSEAREERQPQTNERWL